MKHKLSDEDDYSTSNKMKKAKTKKNNKTKIVEVVKRLQVPKACTNCRKMHTACGTERPCKRCIQHNLTDSCIDIARKKRLTKKELLAKETQAKLESLKEKVSSPPVIVEECCDDHDDHDHHHEESSEDVKSKISNDPLKRIADEICAPSTPISDNINSDVIALALGLSEDTVLNYDFQDVSYIKHQIQKLGSQEYSFNEVIGLNDECKEIIKDMKSWEMKQWDLSIPQNSWKIGLDQFQKEHNFYPTEFLFDYTNLSNEDPLIATNTSSISQILPQQIIHQAQLVIQQQQLNEDSDNSIIQDALPTPTITPLPTPQPTPTVGRSQPQTPPQQPLLPVPKQMSQPTTPIVPHPNPFVTQVLPNLSNMELNHLIQQIADLKDANKSLEGRVNELNREKEKLINNHNTNAVAINTAIPQPTYDANFIWSSCVYSHTSLSLWQFTDDGNIMLVECNDKFAELLGFQLTDLLLMVQTGFSWKFLNIGTDIIYQSNFPKKMQIVTNVGVKDVYITINPIQGNSRSFMLQVTEMK